MTTFKELLEKSRLLDAAGEYDRADDIITFSRESYLSRLSFRRSSIRTAGAEDWQNQPWAKDWAQYSQPEPEVSPQDSPMPLSYYPKDVQRMMHSFKSGHTPVDYSADQLGNMMSNLGYTYLPSKNKEDHPLLYHPSLEGHPMFNTGMIKVNDHAHGKSKIHYKAMRDLYKALQHTHPHLFQKPV